MNGTTIAKLDDTQSIEINASAEATMADITTVSKDKPTAKQITVDTRSIQYTTRVLSTLNQLRDDKTLCDITLLVQGVSFQAHKNILVVSSEYFARMFNEEYKENSESEVRTISWQGTSVVMVVWHVRLSGLPWHYLRVRVWSNGIVQDSGALNREFESREFESLVPTSLCPWAKYLYSLNYFVDLSVIRKLLGIWSISVLRMPWTL